MKYLITMLMLIIASVTYAQGPSYPRDLTLCWTHPLKYESVDGGVTPGADILDGDLASTRLTVDRQDGTRVVDTLIPTIGLPGERQCTTLVGDIPQPGTYTTFGYAITIDDTSSDPSNASVKKYTGKPRPVAALASQ